MSKWTVEIVIIDTHGLLPRQVIERTDDEDTEMVLKLCQVQSGQIAYDGRNAFVSKPVADPIRRKLVYYIELYEELHA